MPTQNKRYLEEVQAKARGRAKPALVCLTPGFLCPNPAAQPAQPGRRGAFFLEKQYQQQEVTQGSKKQCIFSQHSLGFYLHELYF